MNKLGDNIRLLCMVKGVSQTEMAKKCGITQAAMNNIICGKTEPRLKTTIKIADAFGVSLDYLVNEELTMAVVKKD